MFKIDKLQNKYSWTVTVKVPNNGQYDKFTVKVTYNRLPHEERMALLDRITEISGGDGDDIAKMRDFNSYEDDLLEKVFAGWEKGQVSDENGEVEADAAGRAKLLSITEFRNAVIAGYQESVGGEKAKKGN